MLPLPTVLIEGEARILNMDINKDTHIEMINSTMIRFFFNNAPPK